ncbi:hypothetical protein ABPG74_006226 [Tetrahymena malaccensis]
MQFSSKNTSTTQIVNTKTINTDVWLTEDTKIKIKHLIPIFQLIGATTSNFQNLSNILSLIEKSHSNYFPIKIVIPLFFTFNVTVEFQQFDFVPPTHHLFNLDEQIKKRIYSQNNKHLSNSQLIGNPINLYSSEQQKTLNKLYSTINKYKSKNGNQEHNDYDDEEEDQTILDQASLQFRNILEQKRDKSEDNEDLFDVFQDNNNISNLNNNISIHSNNTSNIQLIPQNQANDKFIRNKTLNDKKEMNQ